MKKSLTLLWAVIIVGSGFLLYNHFSKSPEKYEDIIKTPISQSSTPLQDEVKQESSTNKTYSSIIAEGDQYRENGYMEQAIEAYKKALSQNPNTSEAIYKIGLTYLENNQPAEARLYFKELKEFSNNIEIDILIGKTYINERKIEEASVHFNKLDATNEEVRYYIAILKILYKKHEEAQAELKTLAESNGKAMMFLEAYNEASLHKERKEQHLQAILAKAFIDTGEFEASIPLLYDIIKLQNNYRDAWIMLGYSYLQTGKINDAMDAFMQAKTLDPEKPQTLFLIGIAYAIDDDFENAVKYLEKSLEVGFEPKSLVNQKLADIHLIEKKYDKALQSYIEIINQGITDLNIFTKAVWICVEKIDKPQRAIGIAEKAIKITPDDSPEKAITYSLRGWSFVAYGDYERAKEDLITALNLNPNLDSAYLNLGWMYEKQDMAHIAKEYYKKAYSFGNGNSVANLAAIRFNNILKADISSPMVP